MSETALNNDQFPTNTLTVLLALLISTATAQAMSPEQVAAVGGLFPAVLLALNHIRR